jgi:hypothetical protein
VWRENLDATVRIQREKIGVARDDVRRMAAHSNLKELVIFRVTAGSNLCINLNPFSFAR